MEAHGGYTVKRREVIQVLWLHHKQHLYVVQSIARTDYTIRISIDATEAPQMAFYFIAYELMLEAIKARRGACLCATEGDFFRAVGPSERFLSTGGQRAPTRIYSLWKNRPFPFLILKLIFVKPEELCTKT